MNLLPQVFLYFALAVLGLALPAMAGVWFARHGQTDEHRAAVDAAVGCGELNGLYKFTATFHP